MDNLYVEKEMVKEDLNYQGQFMKVNLNKDTLQMAKLLIQTTLFIRDKSINLVNMEKEFYSDQMEL